MKKIFLCISALAFAVLCACTAKENNEKPIMTPTPIPTVVPTEAIPTNTPRPTPTPSAKDIEDNYINSLESMDWTELTCYVDEATSICNSNLLNYGCLTYDEEGNIYYVERNSGGIYVSKGKGEDSRLIYEDKDVFGWLQLYGDWLYYSTNHAAVKRIHLVTGEVEQVLEEHSGQFIIDNGKLYSDRGYVFDLDGKNKETLQGFEEAGIFYPSRGNGFWICSALGKYKKYNQAYLIQYDGQNLKVINQRGGLPLLAGTYLSTINPETNLRRVWNLETKEEFNFNAWTDQTVVSDGKNFYYKETKVFDPTLEEGESWPGLDTCIYHWDGEKTEAIWMIKSDNLYEMYLTPTVLYCMPQMKIDGKGGYHLLYYILETGETGVIY